MTFVLITEREIYPGINWKNAISYIVGVVTLGIVFGVFSIGVFVYRSVKIPVMAKKQQLLS